MRQSYRKYLTADELKKLDENPSSKVAKVLKSKACTRRKKGYPKSRWGGLKSTNPPESAAAWAIRVKNLREGMRLSVIEMAEIIGCSCGTVYSWEKGNNPPNDIFSKKISELEQDLKYSYYGGEIYR